MGSVDYVPLLRKLDGNLMCTNFVTKIKDLLCF